MNEVSPQEDQKPPIEIPPSALSAVALQAIIESFIQREGTDYGAVEISYEQKQRQVLKQIEAGKVRIIFDPNSESVTLMKSEDFKKLIIAGK